eukprot:1195175-Prorocentrum_minimum.AAC.2
MLNGADRCTAMIDTRSSQPELAPVADRVGEGPRRRGAAGAGDGQGAADGPGVPPARGEVRCGPGGVLRAVRPFAQEALGAGGALRPPQRHLHRRHPIRQRPRHRCHLLKRKSKEVIKSENNDAITEERAGLWSADGRWHREEVYPALSGGWFVGDDTRRLGGLSL